MSPQGKTESPVCIIPSAKLDKNATDNDIFTFELEDLVVQMKD